MLIVSDELRITRKAIGQALEKNDPEPVRTLVQACEARGAKAIDVNTGPLSANGPDAMTFFINAVESATDLPLFIDTTNADAMQAGLKAAGNPVTINGFSLEPEKLERILSLAKTYECSIVGFLLDAKSRVPQDMDTRCTMAVELVEQVVSHGIRESQLIIDPVVPPLTWNNGLDQARQVIDTLRMLPEVLGFKVKTMAGLSNLTTGGQDPVKKARLEATYLAMLAAAGLDAVLMDTSRPGLVAAATTSGLLACEGLFAWDQVPS